MRVRHVRTAGSSIRDTWLQEGQIYTVLEITADGTNIYYRLLTENELTTPALHSADLFTIEDNHIPPSWIVVVSTTKSATFLQLTPAPWAEPRFWERYFDFDEAARNCFQHESQKILMEQ